MRSAKKTVLFLSLGLCTYFAAKLLEPTNGNALSASSVKNEPSFNSTKQMVVDSEIKKVDQTLQTSTQDRSPAQVSPKKQTISYPPGSLSLSRSQQTLIQRGKVLSEKNQQHHQTGFPEKISLIGIPGYRYSILRMSEVMDPAYSSQDPVQKLMVANEILAVLQDGVELQDLASFQMEYGVEVSELKGNHQSVKIKLPRDKLEQYEDFYSVIKDHKNLFKHSTPNYLVGL